FRVFNFPDITAEGSITLGAALTATLLVRGWAPAAATAVGFAGGLVAGALIRLLHTQLRIKGLLRGLLVMTVLCLDNLHVMGKSNVSFLKDATVAARSDQFLPDALRILRVSRLLNLLLRLVAFLLFLTPQCLASISRWITASSSWKRFCLFVCRALSSIMV